MSWPKEYPYQWRDLDWVPIKSKITGRELTRDEVDQNNRETRKLVERQRRTYYRNLAKAGLVSEEFKTFGDWCESKKYLRPGVYPPGKKFKPLPPAELTHIPIMAYDDYLGQAADVVGDDWESIQTYLYFHAFGKLPSR